VRNVEIGRVCVKIAGREAGKKCVVVEKVDKNFVVIDSPFVKRRRCNIRHLEPLDIVVDIKEGASSKEVEEALRKAKAT
jgi:large subunit ribosomal protein L14e